MKLRTTNASRPSTAQANEAAAPLQCPHCQKPLDAPELLCPYCRQPLHFPQATETASPKVISKSWLWLFRPQTLLIVVATVAATLGVYGYIVIQQLSSGRYVAEGDRQIALGDMKAALAAYRRAVQLNPENPEAYERLGWAEYSLARDAEALIHFEQALTLEPDRPMSAYGAGAAAYQLRQYRRAADHLEAASTLNPDNAAVFEYLGLSEYRLGDFASALDHLNVALQLNPESGSIHYYLARTQTQLGESIPAVEHLNQAERLGFDPASVQAGRGLAWLDQGNYEAAKQDLTQALAVSPDKDETALALAQAHYHLGDYAAADAQLAALEGHITVTPLMPAYLAVRGWSALRQGNAQQAQSAFTSWSITAPDDAEAFNALGWAALTALDCQTARQSFEHALELAGGDWPFDFSSLATPNETPEAGLAVACQTTVEPTP
jgi:superkiller protein 3